MLEETVKDWVREWKRQGMKHGTRRAKGHARRRSHGTEAADTPALRQWAVTRLEQADTAQLEAWSERRLFAGDIEAVFKEEWTGEAGLPEMMHSGND